MMVAKAFLDTNILLRATLPAYAEYNRALTLVEQQLKGGFELWISRQVIREYLAQVTRPQNFMNPMPVAEAASRIREFESVYQVADDDAAVTRQLVALLQEFPTGGKQVHDANIVATMLVHQIDTLLTINVDDMRRFEPKIKIIPLTPEEPQP
jgi:predicted nucleic acid-binding protein